MEKLNTSGQELGNLTWRQRVEANYTETVRLRALSEFINGGKLTEAEEQRYTDALRSIELYEKGELRGQALDRLMDFMMPNQLLTAEERAILGQEGDRALEELRKKLAQKAEESGKSLDASGKTQDELDELRTKLAERAGKKEGK